MLLYLVPALGSQELLPAFPTLPCTLISRSQGIASGSKTTRFVAALGAWGLAAVSWVSGGYPTRSISPDVGLFYLTAKLPFLMLWQVPARGS